jgi:ribonucleoside-triphosphate reductase (formate)
MKDKYNKVKQTSIQSDLYTSTEAYEYAMAMTLKELKQAVEGLYHNLNSLQSRSGAQLPFSSINFGTCTEVEGRLIIEAILDAQMKGTGPDHKTAIFPCAIFQYSKDINGKPGAPNYDLYKKSLLSCSKRIYPNFVNYDWSVQVAGQKYDREQKEIAINYLLNNDRDTYEVLVKYFSDHLEESYNLSVVVNEGELEVVPWNVQKPFEISSTMGCRTYNSYDVNCDSEFWIKLFKYIAENDGLPRWKMWSANQKDGRGNICPVTIILPMVAQSVKESLLKKEADVSTEKLVDTFMVVLDKKIDEAVEMLVERYKLICSQQESSARFMWQNDTMFGYDGEDLSSAYKHGTLAVGQVGLAETLQILIGTDQMTEEGLALAKQIEQMFYDKCKKYKANTKLNFGVYYTPAENLCYKALKRFREKYGVIPNVSDQEFFTNSMHVPVFRNLDCFEKIDIESQLTGYSNAGCITYVELDSEVENNIDAIEKIVNYAMEKDIPYFALNRKLSFCKKCGTNGDFEICPHCGATGSEIEQLARVTGYLSTDVSNMNPGKQDETHKRVKHTGQCKLNKNFE